MKQDWLTDQTEVSQHQDGRRPLHHVILTDLLQQYTNPHPLDQL